MKKREFLERLSRGIANLPQEEQNRTIRYYNELLEDYMEDGLPEEEAVARMGSVDEIVEQILRDYTAPEAAPPAAEQPPKKGNTGWIIVLLAILGFPIWIPLAASLFGIFVSVISCLFSFIVTLFSVTLGLACGAVGGIPLALILFCTGNGLKGLLLLGGGLVCAGLAILSFMGSVWLTKRIWRLICWIVKKTAGLFHRKAVA